MGTIVGEQARDRIKVDGFTDKARTVHTGRPQGSPVSGVLAKYDSAPLLEIFAGEGAQDPDVVTSKRQ